MFYFPFFCSITCTTRFPLPVFVCVYNCVTVVCVLSFIDFLSYYLGLRKGIGIYICVYSRICIFHSLRFYIFPLIIQCWFVFSSICWYFLVSIFVNRLSTWGGYRFRFSLYWGNFWHMCLVRYVYVLVYMYLVFILFSSFLFWFLFPTNMGSIYMYISYLNTIYFGWTFNCILYLYLFLSLWRIEERVATSGGKTWLEIESTIVIVLFFVFWFSCYLLVLFFILYLENYKDFFVHFLFFLFIFSFQL